MSDKQRKKHPSEHLNEIEEWGEKQYDPGYWTGGNIPPHIKRGSKKAGILFLSVGILIMIITAYLSSFEFSVNIIIGLLLIIAGLKKIISQ